jgi:hypothetical protein
MRGIPIFRAPVLSKIGAVSQDNILTLVHELFTPAAEILKSIKKRLFSGQKRRFGAKRSDRKKLVLIMPEVNKQKFPSRNPSPGIR